MRLIPLPLATLDTLSVSCEARLHATAAQVQAVLGPANTTQHEDEHDVGSSWCFRDERGRLGYVWSYGYARQQDAGCTRWSLYGDLCLLAELFPSCRIELS